MAIPKVYVGDTGTVIELDAGQDLTEASSLAISVRKPSGELVEWPATVFEQTKLRFSTLADSLDEPGTWKLQALVISPAGRWLGQTVMLRVLPEFEA